MIDNKTSLLVSQQLPEFVRDNPDYQNFTLFVRAYYEWMESANAANSLSTTANSQGQGVTYASKNLLNYSDIDNTIDDFTDYYLNDFLPYFPTDSLITKQQAVKIARQLYETKGTPASYEFLFRVLYNSDFDIFYTKDAILKASDGTWYITKSLKLLSTDEQFLNIQNYRMFGEYTKSIATIETSVQAGNKIEVFISDIQRLFQSGEFVRVVDANNQDVYFKDGQVVSSTTSGASILRAKIVGQLSSVAINKDPYRGKYYSTGDPVVVYGGLASNTGIGASAVVDKINTGSITRISVTNGGQGYSLYPNTFITFDIETNGANAVVYSVDTAKVANVAMIPIDTIALKKDLYLGNSVFGTAANTRPGSDPSNIHYGNPNWTGEPYYFANNLSANANTTILEALTFTEFPTFPISSVFVVNGGGGIRQKPGAEALGGYQSDLISYGANVANTPLLASIGILAPIQITDGGQGYQNNETIIFTGGMGQGAYANVVVNSTGGIVKVNYVEDTLRRYPLGGMGYRNDSLPTVTVDTAAGTDAVLYVPSILGTGAVLAPETDNAGEIVTIKLIDYGEDYIATPNVSLRVQDIVTTNVSVSLPQKGEVIYQGNSLDFSTYTATVNSVSILQRDADPTKSLYNIRVFNYSAMPDPLKQFNIERAEPDVNLHITMVNTAYAANHFFVGSPEYITRATTKGDVSGVKTYGDGTARGTAKFLNGLVISEGQYLDSKGQPSSFSVLQSDIYNNYTYQITVQKEISKYRDMLLNLLHPTGMKVIGRYALKSNSSMSYTGQQATYTGTPLYYYTGTGPYATITTSFANKSNNEVTFHDMPSGTDRILLSDFLTANTSRISMTPTNGININALVVDINDTANTITLDANTWMTFGNVMIASVDAGSDTINISSFTVNSWIANNRIYEAEHPLQYLVSIGDTVSINNEIKLVQSIDYVSNTIQLTTNMTDSVADGYLSVNRQFRANTNLQYDQIRIFGPLGLPYDNPVLVADDGSEITTEDGVTILIG